MPDHDTLYHRLFSHPGMVAQLLREFVAGPWLDDLDLEGMERLNAKFHAETSERRDGDMIWRIPRRGGGETWLVLLLEFQSTSDPWMALRALVYAGLLWQQLVKEKRLPPDGRLPPILPVVLYNGDRRWMAPLALLFRLESSPDPAQVVVLADAVLGWFARHPGFESLRSAFAALLSGLMGPLDPAVHVPEELLEVRNMLATRAEMWKQQWLTEGRQEGEAAMLLRLLERRFGSLPAWAGDRIGKADTATLEEWSLRVLDAGSLDDILASSGVAPAHDALCRR
jgi:hypothetical protein